MKNLSLYSYGRYYVLLSLFFYACEKNQALTVLAAPPAIISISPSEGPGDTTVTIRGSGFGALSLDSVFFNGESAVISTANDSQLVVTVPPLAGTGNVTMRINGIFVTGPSFTYDYRYVVSTIAGSYNAGYQDGTGVNALFVDPTGTLLGSDGNLYVTESGDIRIVTPGGVVTTLVGSGYGSFIGGTGNSAGFFGAAGITQDRSGNLYVADVYNNLIRKVAAGGIVTTLAGNPNPGAADGTGSAASFYSPTGIVADSVGNLYVADFDNEKIRMVTPGGVVTTLAGLGTQGAVDGPAAAATFKGPTGIVADGKGNFYIADGANDKIRMLSAGGIVSTIAGSGIPSFADGVGAGASFYFPYGMAMDHHGNLIVADQLNSRIRMVTSAGVVTTLAGSGNQGAVDGPGPNASFYFPTGVAVDSTGNIYVADNANDRIRKLTIQ